MKKKNFFLFRILVNIFRYFKLKKIKKNRKKNRKKHPLQDYNYPLW